MNVQDVQQVAEYFAFNLCPANVGRQTVGSKKGGKPVKTQSGLHANTQPFWAMKHIYFPTDQSTKLPPGCVPTRVTVQARAEDMYCDWFESDGPSIELCLRGYCAGYHGCLSLKDVVHQNLERNNNVRLIVPSMAPTGMAMAAMRYGVLLILILPKGIPFLLLHVWGNKHHKPAVEAEPLSYKTKTVLPLPFCPLHAQLTHAQHPLGPGARQNLFLPPEGFRHTADRPPSQGSHETWETGKKFFPQNSSAEREQRPDATCKEVREGALDLWGRAYACDEPCEAWEYGHEVASECFIGQRSKRLQRGNHKRATRTGLLSHPHQAAPAAAIPPCIALRGLPTHLTLAHHAAGGHVAVQVRGKPKNMATCFIVSWSFLAKLVACCAAHYSD